METVCGGVVGVGPPNGMLLTLPPFGIKELEGCDGNTLVEMSGVGGLLTRNDDGSLGANRSNRRNRRDRPDRRWRAIMVWMCV